MSARDIDIFDNKVTFSTNFAGIVAVSTKPETGSDGKTFYSMLTLTAPLIKLVQPVEFTLTATVSRHLPFGPKIISFSNVSVNIRKGG